jgi:hypothetical protein
MQASTGQLYAYPDNRYVTSRYDRIYQKRSTYYLVDAKGDLHIPTPHSVMKFFPGEKKIIRSYVRAQRVNFRSQDDLVRLLEFSRRAEMK